MTLITDETNIFLANLLVRRFISPVWTLLMYIVVTLVAWSLEVLLHICCWWVEFYYICCCRTDSSQPTQSVAQQILRIISYVLLSCIGRWWLCHDHAWSASQIGHCQPSIIGPTGRERVGRHDSRYVVVYHSSYFESSTL